MRKIEKIFMVKSFTDNRDWKEPGEKVEYCYSNAMCSAFPSLFPDCEDNYEVERTLRKHKVVRKNSNTDTETCQFYIFFSSKRSAESFVNRFNKWTAKQYDAMCPYTGIEF